MNLREKYRAIKDKTKLGNATNAYDAFSQSMLTHYPDPASLGWDLVTKYEAYKLINGRISRETFRRYIEAGHFRSVDGKVYFQEVAKFSDMLDLVDSLYEAQILEARDSKIYLIPADSDRRGKILSQRIKAAAYVFNQDWFKDMIVELAK